MSEKILLFDSRDRKLKRMKITFASYIRYCQFCAKYKIGIFQYHDGSKAIICFK